MLRLCASKYTRYGASSSSVTNPCATMRSASLPVMYVSPTGSPALMRRALIDSVSGFHGPLFAGSDDRDVVKDLETAVPMSLPVGHVR